MNSSPSWADGVTVLGGGGIDVDQERLHVAPRLVGRQGKEVEIAPRGLLLSETYMTLRCSPDADDHRPHVLLVVEERARAARRAPGRCRIRGPSDGISAPGFDLRHDRRLREPARSASCSSSGPRDSRTACTFRRSCSCLAMRHLVAIRGWPDPAPLFRAGPATRLCTFFGSVQGDTARLDSTFEQLAPRQTRSRSREGRKRLWRGMPQVIAGRSPERCGNWYSRDLLDTHFGRW